VAVPLASGSFESVGFLVSEAHTAILLSVVAGPQRVVNGLSSFALPVTLPRNAVVRRASFVVTAKRAGATAIETVAQYRVSDSASTDLVGRGKSIVVDFGMPRTVSAVQVPHGLSVVRVTPWIGAGFAPSAAYAASVASSIPSGALIVNPPSPSTVEFAFLRSEIRTERLLVEIVGNPTEAQLAQVAVVLPESPNDLEIRIDGGAPVWKAPGPAQQGTGKALSEQDWNEDNQRLVNLGPAFAALTGDPAATDNVTFDLVLTSRVPGVLKVEPNPAEYDVIRRLRFGTETSREITFDSEGSFDLPIDLPPPAGSSPRLLREIRFTALGKPTLERVLPPIGPAFAQKADLILDSHRSALVRIAPGESLSDILGVRLPLRTGPAGAEARIVLWHNRLTETQEPDAAFGAEGTSEPVTLAESDTENWVTFPFRQAVKFDPKNPPWAALVVSRGEVVWPLGESSGLDATMANVIRLGPPAGPWKVLPPPFFDVASGLSGARGRIRVAGTTPKEKPLAPWLLQIGASTPLFPVLPTPKGVAFRLELPSLPAADAGLRVISHLAGTLTLRDVDVISSS